MSSPLSPKKKYESTARCNKCGYRDSRVVEVEPENLENARLSYGAEIAKKHREHPDLNYWEIVPKEL